VPPRNSAIVPSPSHWSKDFVEHLRTVHFTLISVAIGLILIVVSAKPYNAAMALREIHQIIELKKMWSINWLFWKGTRKEIPVSEDNLGSEAAPAPQTLAGLGEPSDWDISNLPTPIVPEDYPRGVDVKSDLSVFQHNSFTGRLSRVGSKRQETISFWIERPWLQEHTHPDWSPETFPDTLLDFQEWWNVLQTHPYRAVIPSSLYIAEGSCGNPSHNSDVSALEIQNSVMPNSIALTAQEAGKTLIYTAEDTSLGLCFFPIRRFMYVEVSQQMLASQFNNWKTESFDDSFADLARAGHDLETLELDDVEKFVSTEAAKGSEVFEAFGMKFPAGQINFWGLVVLLGVQLYFFVYLKELSGKLVQTDAGWDVPWIGMDTSLLAQTIFFLTVVLLPSVATILLGRHAISLLGKPIVWRSWSVAETCGVVAAIVPALVLGILSWKYRPNIQEGDNSSGVEKTSAVNTPSASSQNSEPE
jgi:hypothetical protein